MAIARVADHEGPGVRGREAAAGMRGPRREGGKRAPAAAPAALRPRPARARRPCRLTSIVIRA